MKEYVVHHAINTEKELDSFKQFLKLNNLPADDVSLSNNLFIAFYNTHETLVGTGGLEFYNDLALLRSLAVSPELRGQQLGKEIVNQLLEEARVRSVREIYLLTQTATYFFQKLGFEIVAREHVPESIRMSSEFTQACPSSAEVLKLALS